MTIINSLGFTSPGKCFFQLRNSPHIKCVNVWFLHLVCTLFFFCTDYAYKTEHVRLSFRDSGVLFLLDSARLKTSEWSFVFSEWYPAPHLTLHKNAKSVHFSEHTAVSSGANTACIRRSSFTSFPLRLTLAFSKSRSLPMVVSSLHRHSKDSSSWFFSSLTTQSCMMASVNILSLKSSPMNLMLPMERRRALSLASSSSSWSRSRSVDWRQRANIEDVQRKRNTCQRSLFFLCDKKKYSGTKYK